MPEPLTREEIEKRLKSLEITVKKQQGYIRTHYPGVDFKESLSFAYQDALWDDRTREILRNYERTLRQGDGWSAVHTRMG